MNNFTLYMQTVPNGKRYIGITRRNPKDRWNGGSGYSSNEEFHEDIKKYGWNNIKHEILKSGMSQKEAEEWEVRMIAHYDTTNPEKGYNFSKGGMYGGSGGSARLINKLKSRSASPNSKPCMCVENGRRYNSVAEAARDMRLPRGGIDMSCMTNGVREVRKYHFVYIGSEAHREVGRQQVLRDAEYWEWEW